MSSLAQLLTAHRRLLVLDAASSLTQVGLIQAEGDARWHQQEAEAGTALFRGVESVLTAANAKLAEVDAFVFCEGPGSMLGGRTIAMAVRTWQTLRVRPAYAYQSLAAAGCHTYRLAPRPLSVIADARRETWHLQSIAPDGSPAPLRRVPAAELPIGELQTPQNFKAWAPLPAGVSICSYDLAKIFPAIAGIDFFRATEAPDVFQHEAPEYKKWSAQVHSAANATK
jgi:tRNA threonylcarbamoyladenosine biosynthesis protein TsaB